MAAVNLLCMSVRERDLVEAAAEAEAEAEAGGSGRGGADHGGAPAPASLGAGAGLLPALYAATAAAAAAEDASSALLTSPLLALPPATRDAVVGAKEALDAAARTAAAADAAVAAVARVLALRQAAALRARADAGRAAGKLAALMSALDGRYGWSRLAAAQQAAPVAASFPGAAPAAP
jgi:hypothetical protein